MLAAGCGLRIHGRLRRGQDACIEIGTGFATAMRTRQQGGQGALFGIQRLSGMSGHAGSLARSLSIA